MIQTVTADVMTVSCVTVLVKAAIFVRRAIRGVRVVLVVSPAIQVAILSATIDVMTVRQVLMSVSDMPALSVMLPAIVGLQLHRK